MIDTTPNAIIKALKEWKYEPKLQTETGQIYLILHYHGIDFPLFVRIFDQSDLLQLLVFMPSKIKPGTEEDLARLLHLVNKEMDIPGFGMDENAAVVFYRAMLPTPDKKIDPAVLQAYIKSIHVICESLSQPVLAVASGQTTYAEIIRVRDESLNIQKTRFTP